MEKPRFFKIEVSFLISFLIIGTGMKSGDFAQRATFNDFFGFLKTLKSGD